MEPRRRRITASEAVANSRRREIGLVSRRRAIQNFAFKRPLR
jgi:hypothetical protein